MQNSFIASPLVEQYLAPPDPHETERIKPFGVFTLVLAIMTLIIESLLMYLTVQNEGFLPYGIFGHLLVCGILLVLFVIIPNMLAANRLFLALLLISTAPLGPVGAAGVVMAMLMCLWFSALATPFSEWFSSIFPSLKMSEPEEVDQDLRTGRDESGKHYAIEPFMDVIRYGTDDQKRRALSKITSYFSPGFAPALLRALGDKSNMIRVQAATAISIIENRFQERLIKLSKLYEKRPEEAEVILALANFHDDYSFTGILDEERERQNRTRAKELYQKYLDKRPGDDAIRTRFGRLLLRMGQHADAIVNFEQAFSHNRSATSAAWLAEAYFRAGHYDAIRRMATELLHHYPDTLKNMEASVRHSLQSWTGNPLKIAQEEV